MSNRASLDTSRESSELSRESLLDPTKSILDSNPKSIAYLVYANRGDPHTAGYKPPSLREIPQIKLPRLGSQNNSEIYEYLDLIRKLESLEELQEDSDGSKDRTDLLPLSSVPDVFFSDKFQLNNPRTFDAVINQNHSAIVQEKLSSYVDIVEAHLTNEIAMASTKFFEATAQFDAMELQCLSTNQLIAEFLETAIAQKQVVAHYQETKELQQKLKDAMTLCEAIEYLVSVCEMVSQLEAAAVSDIFEGLNQLESIQKTLANGKVDLKQVISAQPLLDRVEIVENQLKTQIKSLYATQMMSALRLVTANMNANSEYEEIITQARRTLDRASHLGVRDACLAQYHAEVDREVKLVVRRNLPMNPLGTNRSTNPEESQFLARSLHSLAPEEAESLFNSMFTEITALLNALLSQGSEETSANLIEAAVNSVDLRISRVLRVRKDPVSMLSAPKFIKFHSQITKFCDFLEKISTSQTSELREFLVAQTKLYSHCLQSRFDEDLVSSMESDDWRRIEISSHIQKSTNIINEAYLQDPPLEFYQEMENQAGDANAENNCVLRLVIDSETFLLSRSASRLIQILVTLLQLVSYLPSTQSILTARVILEMLQTYNNKAFQQVVQHGAVRTAGLKHINIRNLLVSHESLRMVEKLISPIRHCVERHSPSANGAAIMEQNIAESVSTELHQAFDAVQQAYFNHRSEIQQRIVKLLGDKANFMAKQIVTTDWNIIKTSNGVQDGNGSSNGVSINMVDLMRQTMSVANTCQEMLPESIAEDIVSKIFASFKPKLLEAYTQLKITTLLEKQNVLHDIEYFRVKSSALKGAGNIADVIYESFITFVAPDIIVDEVISSPEADQSVDQMDSSMVIDQDVKLENDNSVLEPVNPINDKDLVDAVKSKLQLDKTRDAKEENPVVLSESTEEQVFKGSDKEEAFNVDNRPAQPTGNIISSKLNKLESVQAEGQDNQGTTDKGSPQSPGKSKTEDSKVNLRIENIENLNSTSEKTSDTDCTIDRTLSKSPGILPENQNNELNDVRDEQGDGEITKLDEISLKENLASASLETKPNNLSKSQKKRMKKKKKAK